MKYLVLIFFLVACTTTPKKTGNNVKEAAFYGKKIYANKAVELDSVINNFNKYKGKKVVMAANVEKVCAAKGCWMTLQGTDQTFRVKFKDYDFFVPMSLIGQKVWVEGEVVKKEVSVAHTKHYLEDAGASQKEIDVVKKPTVEYRIIAQGVRPL